MTSPGAHAVASCVEGRRQDPLHVRERAAEQRHEDSQERRILLALDVVDRHHALRAARILVTRVRGHESTQRERAERHQMPSRARQRIERHDLARGADRFGLERGRAHAGVGEAERREHHVDHLAHREVEAREVRVRGAVGRERPCDAGVGEHLLRLAGEVGAGGIVERRRRAHVVAEDRALGRGEHVRGAAEPARAREAHEHEASLGLRAAVEQRLLTAPRRGCVRLLVREDRGRAGDDERMRPPGIVGAEEPFRDHERRAFERGLACRARQRRGRQRTARARDGERGEQRRLADAVSAVEHGHCARHARVGGVVCEMHGRVLEHTHVVETHAREAHGSEASKPRDGGGCRTRPALPPRERGRPSSDRDSSRGCGPSRTRRRCSRPRAPGRSPGSSAAQ